eukprot:3079837-Lingulodinium_polyedra.AAC.1
MAAASLEKCAATEAKRRESALFAADIVLMKDAIELQLLPIKSVAFGDKRKEEDACPPRGT